MPREDAIDRPASQTPADEGLLNPSRRAAILTDLERRGVGASEITGWRVTSVTWRDSSLGCPSPGVAYADVLVPGQRVQVTAGGRGFDYRFGRGDVPLLCEHYKPRSLR